jgi:hypothetical protein
MKSMKMTHLIKDLSLSLSLSLIFIMPSHAQDQKEVLSKLDTTVFKGRPFLNKAGFVSSTVEQFRNKVKNDKGETLYRISKDEF